MKKFLTKGKITTSVMLLALAFAVILNMKYSGKKYLGEASFVSADASDEAVVETSAKVQSDFLAESRENRDKAYTEAVDLINETLKNADATDEQKAAAANKATLLAENKTAEANAEALLSAKGFKNPLVIFADEGVTVIVNSAELSSGETLQIKDAVCSVKKVNTENIKIVAVNS